MLPKLQNSSLAQTLKRENLAFQVQCNLSLLSKVRTNLRDSSVSPATKIINHGKIIMPPKIHTVLSVTSLKNIFLKKNSLNKDMSHDIN